MKKTYPVILTKVDDGGYIVDIPDFNSGTQGEDLDEAIDMAADAIGLMGIVMEDEGKEIPEPNSVQFELKQDEILKFVEVDFIEYRKKADNTPIINQIINDTDIQKWNLNCSNILNEYRLIIDIYENPKSVKVETLEFECESLDGIEKMIAKAVETIKEYKRKWYK